MTVRFLHPDRRVIWLELTRSGLFDGAGRLVRVSGLVRDVSERKRAEEQQEWLIGELNHRVKNTLARIKVVIQRSRETQSDIDAYAAAIAERIDAMARTHNRLTEKLRDGVSLEVLIEDELQPYMAGDNVRLEGPEIILQPTAAQALTTPLNELATNAAKHGALSRSGGHVEVRWQLVEVADRGRTLRLSWREHTTWPVAPPAREGYGLHTIRNQPSFELQARVDFRITSEGVRCDFEIPAARVLVAGGDRPAPGVAALRAAS
jgi:two-component sensor histidine kinase